MSLNAAALRLMREKGLSLDDVVEIAAAMESRSKAAERQSRYRQRKRDVTRDVTPPLNEDTSNPPVDKPEPDGSGQKPPSEIDQAVEAWNAMAGRTGLKPIRTLNAARRTALKARLRVYGLAEVLAAIERIERSDFCAGRTDRWKGASFDFLISDSKFLRLIEGNYDNRDGSSGKPAAPLPPEEAASLAELSKARDTLPLDEWHRMRAAHFSRFGKSESGERSRGPPRPVAATIDAIVKRMSVDNERGAGG